MMQRIINAKTKVGLKSNAIVWDLDAYCFRSYCPSHNTYLKMQIQNFNIKDFKSEKSRLTDLKLAKKKIYALPYPKFTEPRKFFYFNKKKEYVIKKK